MFKSIEGYRKIVLLLFLIKHDENLLREIGFSERDIKSLNLEFKNILIEQHEEIINYVKDQKESFVERFLNK